MMVRIEAVILLLQLTVCTTASQPLCQDKICWISPDNFWQLQGVINSNQIIILSGTKFSVDDNIGFIVIENVSNMTISAGGKTGSLIHCSPVSSFGFHLRNATNVTLTRINITNCASVMPDLAMWFPGLSCPPNDSCQTSVLIEASRYIGVIGVHIDHSPGHAITVVDSPTNETFWDPPFIMENVMSPNVALTHSTISHSGGKSMVIVETRSLLIENTVIANSTYGICSESSVIMLKAVDIVNCKLSPMNDGRTVVRERLSVYNSSINIFQQGIDIRGSSVHFTGDGTYNYGLIGVCSDIFIAEHSVVVFTRFNYIALSLREYSHLSLNNSTLIFTKNNASTISKHEYEPMFLNLISTQMDIFNGSSLVITYNSIVSSTLFWNSVVILNAGKLYFEKNEGQKSSRKLAFGKHSGLIHSNDTTIELQNESCISISRNKWLTIYIFGGDLTILSDSVLLVLDNVAERSLVLFLKVNSIILDGTVILARNNATTAAISIYNSNVVFSGSLEVRGNRGIKGGGIYAFTSGLWFKGTARFSNNCAANGGAMALHTSVMYISSTATVEFNSNTAQDLGGAIYIFRPTMVYPCFGFDYVACSTRMLPGTLDLFSITFNQNRAGIAGNAIYGGWTSACLPSENFCDFKRSNPYIYTGVNDSSDLSNFTSDPTRVCFCENGIPDCYKILSTIAVHPGERFYVSLAIVGYGLGTVPGSVIARGSVSEGPISEWSLFGSELEMAQEIQGTVCQDVGYSIMSEADREQIALAVETQSLLTSLEEAQSFLMNIYVHLPDGLYHIPVFVEVDLLPCPVGFQLVSGKCICHQILLDNNVDTCFFSNGTALILRPVPYWIGLPNNTNSSILINSHCPYDYCQSDGINITAESPNTQCQYQRSGVLCGSCREGLSMILGSSECKTCSYVYLTSLAVFILMGMALVALVTLLNMTVSVGTLNGLILLANILQANKTEFLPQTTPHTHPLIAVLSAFIAWLNLDLGIPMCFFDGLTTYTKTWLQFVFPLYILALVTGIIIASKYSSRATRLLGTNTVSVLATLVLLSYTKILRILITAFSFTTLTGSQGYHSVVWLADGNVKYFEPKHAILFLVALLALLLVGIPFTVTLTAAPWIQRSRFKWVSSLYNKFKPLFDAYMGPYKDSHRYWTGMLLLVRVVMLVLFSSIANTNTVAGPQLNLLLLSLSSFLLCVATAALKPYKNKLVNGLEIFHLTILFIFSSTNLYVSHIETGVRPHAYIYIVFVGVCFLVFLGICGGHMWYRVRKARTGRRPGPPPEREEEEYRPLVWQRARVRPEDEEGEVVVVSTAGATNTISCRGRRESLVELIATTELPQ